MNDNFNAINTNQVITYEENVSYQLNTTNKSFLTMYYYLRDQGHKNCMFHLVLFDRGLMNINPRDPNLPVALQRRVFFECKKNFWYFVREVVRVPVQGGEVGGGVQYELHRGNLALNFGFLHNWNMFAEFPRQHGKTVAALVWYLWVFLFGTRGSEMMFFNKRLEDSKMNLQRLREYRAALPVYLRFDAQYGVSNKKIKAQDNVQTLENIYFKNTIKAAASARTKVAANSLGRGCTIPIIYWDEYAFIPYNYIIYQSAIPAFSKASRNARMNMSPYGILITTTPGDLLTEEGKDAYNTKNMATPFQESFYDLPPQKLNETLQVNTKSSFVYIKYTYKQLGRGEEYFDQMVKDLKRDAAAIQREVLLIWASSATNSPFESHELDMVKNMIKKPIAELAVYRQNFVFQIYKGGFFNTPPIIGVDVAGGFSRDSSAITIIDSKTTDVIAVFNCNYISILDLGRVIVELITKYFPNAIVNVERNGGFGHALLAYLLEQPGIKKNLYYEIKDVVTEDRYDGYRRTQRKVKTRVYGFNETEKSRSLLMEMLKGRMEHHKDKFTAEIIYEQLCQLEIKNTSNRNIMKYGPRIEHMDNGHDDQIFSYLLALYVFYYGENLRENFGFVPGNIEAEHSDTVEEYIPNDALEKDISMEILYDPKTDEVIKEASQMLNYNNALNTTIGVDAYRKRIEEEEDRKLMIELASDPRKMKEYSEKYVASTIITNINTQNGGLMTLPESVYNMDIIDDEDENADKKSALQKEFEMIVPK